MAGTQGSRRTRGGLNQEDGGKQKIDMGKTHSECSLEQKNMSFVDLNRCIHGEKGADCGVCGGLSWH